MIIIKIDKLLNLAINILFYIGVVALVLYVVAGFKYYNVKYSLLNDIKVGSVAVLMPPKDGRIPNNKIITYQKSEQVTTLYKVISDNGTDIKITNNQETLNGSTKNVTGVLVISIPILGKIATFISTTIGLVTILGLVVVYFILKKLVFKK